MSSHKPRRPRWPAINNTMAVAQDNASKIDPSSLAQILQTLANAAKALREGKATRHQWAVLAGSLDLAKSIERQGIVRGLQGTWDDADTALQHIYARSDHDGQWRPTALYYSDIEAINTFISLHGYQCRQLSLAEYKQAITSAAGQICSSGDRVTMVKVQDGAGAAV